MYFVPPKNRSGGGTLTWGWSEEDKNRILALANPLKAIKEISGAYIISDAVVSGSDLDAYRLAAARYGADAILVISGINDVDSYFNGWRWTYVLILPALFVPASERDALFVTQAVMWDVRNDFLYLAADGQSLKTQTRPAAYIDEKKLVNEAKAEAFDKLCAQLTNMVGDLLQQQIKQ